MYFLFYFREEAKVYRTVTEELEKQIFFLILLLRKNKRTITHQKKIDKTPLGSSLSEDANGISSRGKIFTGKGFLWQSRQLKKKEKQD